MRKYGVIWYEKTDNIGDDIQTYAASRFLPHIDCLLEREHLDSFFLPDEEKVVAIFNGWFLHKKYRWPPNPNIFPLCIGIHFTPNDQWDIGYHFLDGIGGDYLRTFAPIGCRDEATYQELKKRDIRAYISGCLTLTLPRRPLRADAGSYICAVDVTESVHSAMKAKLRQSNIEVKQITHWVDYCNMERPPEWNKRQQVVEQLLDCYQNARCVVTTRLHCALPCLAMGVPVLLLYDSSKDDSTRYSTFLQWLYHCTTQEFLENKVNFDLRTPPENRNGFLMARNNIEKEIKFFLENTLRSEMPKFSYTEVQKKEWQKLLLEKIANQSAERIEKIKIQIAEQQEKRDYDITELGKYSAALQAQIRDCEGRLQKEISLRNQVETCLEDKIRECTHLKMQVDVQIKQNKEIQQRAEALQQQIESLLSSRLVQIALTVRRFLKRK
ncbi:polysaccharide pyruvyl transferase family protein [Anaerofilum sp. BX8]|uniref:Polysaccharide pyruvyl transferase family protein n=1 Tax=Anaerofilum hominis TaxID=2763016 RepID=A0A923I969_9FIRM|nr:polysaccharide pyruvyl transferase family protein [Anaerofilum hominis]MBC5581414.1 polysaccharide pyruvyl transferase family protein [Anaerofilum hominis]